MPEWCPKCHAMLPEGLDRCPSCGKRLRSGHGESFSFKDILGISSSVLLVVLIPLIIVIIGGLLCIVLGN
jgi:hypothetical protein